MKNFEIFVSRNSLKSDSDNSIENLKIQLINFGKNNDVLFIPKVEEEKGTKLLKLNIIRKSVNNYFFY